MILREWHLWELVILWCLGLSNFMCHTSKWKGEDGDENSCSFHSPSVGRRRNPYAARAKVTGLQVVRGGEKTEEGRSQDRTFQSMAGTQDTWSQQRPTAPPKALHRASGGRAISGEAGMLASICHDGLISGSRVHWRDLIRGGLSDLWCSRCYIWQAWSKPRVLPLLLRALCPCLPRGPPGVAVGWVTGHSAQWVLMEPGGGTVGSRVTLPGFKPDSHTYLTVWLCLRPLCLVWASSVQWK